MATTRKRDKAPTITKKELIDRIADNTDSKRVVVKKIIQRFLDAIVEELGRGNRLEFRDFGVFETRVRKPRMAQNPKTLERVPVSEKRTVKFKVGRLMKQRLSGHTLTVVHANGPLVAKAVARAAVLDAAAAGPAAATAVAKEAAPADKAN